MSAKVLPSRADLTKNDQALWDLICNYASEILPETFNPNPVSKRCLIWLPQTIEGSSVCVASSRLGQKLDQQESWFDALRTLSVQIQRERKFLITAAGTTADPFLRRIATLFGIRLVEFKQFPRNPSASWFERISEEQAKAAPDAVTLTAWYQPVESSKQVADANVNDLLVSIARSTILLSVRKRGKILRAAQSRLANLKRNPTGQAIPTTQLLINRKLTCQTVESDLLEDGATGWWLYREQEPAKNTHPESPAKISPLPKTPNVHTGTSTQAFVLQPDEIKPDEYLLHWTRRRVGPWPDQTTPEFLDDLIFQNSRRNHNELSSLCRILAARKILASHDLTRDRRAVVCFSNLSIRDLPKRRVFRPHLSRWDFEPYGIAIDRALMSQLGAKPVYYGEESEWESLAPEQQPYFQLKQSRSEKIDWQTEREWRILGDLPLDQISHDRAFVFVGETSDVDLIAGLTHWPIVVVPTNGLANQGA